MNAFVDQVSDLLAAGDYDAALDLVMSAAQPAAKELGLAQLALVRQDAAAASTHARRAIELGAGAPAHHFLAAATLASGDPQAAVDEARRAVALDASPRSRSSLGGVLLAAGRPGDAVAVLRQVVSETPDDPDALLNLATASARTGDYGEAIQQFARALQRRPADHRPVQNLIAMFAEVGKWLGALAALEMSRKGEPPADVAVALDLSAVHIIRTITGGKYPPAGMASDADDAINNLVANARRSPIGTRLTAARTLLELERVAEAQQLIADLDRAALPPPDRAQALYVDGFVAQQQRDTARALGLYEQALAADPRRVDAAVNATSLLLEDGSEGALAKIQGWIDRVVQMRRMTDPNLLYNEAVYLARSGRANDARDRLERILQITSGRGPAADRARRALEDLGRTGA